MDICSSSAPLGFLHESCLLSLVNPFLLAQSRSCISINKWASQKKTSWLLSLKWIIGRRGCSGDAFWEIAFYSFRKWKSCDLSQPNQLKSQECRSFVVGRNLWKLSCATPDQAGSSRTICPGSCPVGSAVIDTIHPEELDVRVWLLDISGSPAPTNNGPNMGSDLGQTQCQISPSKITIIFTCF